VIGLHRSGVNVAVATNGTALGDDHFELLRRFCDRIVLAFDADAAGGRAALRGDELAVPVDLRLDLRVAAMPAGVDPAEMVQSGRVDEFRTAVDRSVPLLQFWLERELDLFDPREPESRARALKLVGARLAKVDDDLARGEYARFVADRLGVDMDTVERAIGRRPARSGGWARESQAPVSRATPRARAEAELLRTLLTDAGLVRSAEVDASWFESQWALEAFEAIGSLAEGVDDGSPVPLPSSDHPASDVLTRLAMTGKPVSPITDVKVALSKATLDERIAELEADLTRLAPEEQTSSPILSELLRLQKERRALEGGRA